MHLISTDFHVRDRHVNIVGVLMKAVKTFFVLHPQNDEGTGSQTYRQTGDVNDGIYAVAA
jgi:hypothetical protein